MEIEERKEHLRVKISDVSSGVLVPLGRVLAEQVGSHARRYTSRHGFDCASFRSRNKAFFFFNY